MFTLKSRKDGFRLLIPKEFIPDEINEKYTNILKSAKSFYTRPIDFLNESIRKVDVLGFNNATMQQQQTTKGFPLRNPNRMAENAFQGASTDVSYRAATNPIQLIDKTLNVEFRHTLGFLNYFLLIETFFYHYTRDTHSKDLESKFRIDILNENGAIYSSVILHNPLIDGIDMLSLDNSQPVAQDETFKCIFKYSNFTYEFIDVDARTEGINLEDYINEITPNYPYSSDDDIMRRNPNRIPIFKTNSPIPSTSGNLPYKDEWMGPNSDGQIFYEDEGGVLKDIVHHEKVNSDKEYQQSTGGFHKESSEDSSSFISDLATAKSENPEKLAENNKFLLYPYPKDYAEGKKELANGGITSSLDKSSTKNLEDGEITNEYKDNSELSNWNEDDFQKFKNKG